MDTHPFVAHILSQTRQNLEFLIAQNQISENDGRDILAKLSAPAAVVRSSSPAETAAPTVLFRAKALWDYNEDPNDLSFNAGEIIDITSETNSDWWAGRHRGRIGLFPSNYVKRLSVPPPSVPPPAPSLPSPTPTPYASPYGGPEKAPMYPIPPLNPYPSYQPPGGYQPPPPGGVYNPYGGPTQPPPPPPNTVIASTPEQPEQPPKKGKFGGKFGSTLAHSAVGGVGFGAGSAVGSGIINSLF